MIKDYDVSFEPKDDTWEELTVEEFFDRENATEVERVNFKNSLFATNIHILVSEETYDNIIETFHDVLSKEEKLQGLNAIVLLNLKKKGRGVGHTRLSDEKFNKLVRFALESKIPIGFDSCGCHRFLQAIEGLPNYKELEMLSEPCESGLFSSYINVHGRFFPCSFTEGTEGWIDGIDVPGCSNFVVDVWNNERTKEFRQKLLMKNRNCPIYEV